MNTKNFLLGGIVGGIVFFLLGWLFYGNLFADYFREHPGTATGVAKPMDQIVWWALILGNLIAGFFLAYIFSKSGVSTPTSGLVMGAVLGLLMSCSTSLIIFATSNIYSKHILLADVGITLVRSALAGAAVGAVMGMGNRATVNTAV